MKINTEDCKECNGRGYLAIRKSTIIRCKKCFGSGKLDWVEAIVGSTWDQRKPNLEQLIRKYEKDNGWFQSVGSRKRKIRLTIKSKGKKK